MVFRRTQPGLLLYLKLFQIENTELEIKEDALKEIAKKAIKKKTGARGLRTILENLLLKTMFELPDMKDVAKITIDKNVVKQNGEPLITFSKNSSTSVA